MSLESGTYVIRNVASRALVGMMTTGSTTPEPTSPIFLLNPDMITEAPKVSSYVSL
jgi:hypothetical protein